MPPYSIPGPLASMTSVPWWAHRPALVPVMDASQVGEARRAAVALAELVGFDEADRGRVALVATEMATNLARHARDGVLLVHAAPEWGDGTERVAVELVAVDKGPGITDVARSMRDGYSTGGTPGGGFGAMRRQADAFDLHSTPGRGTVVLARLVPRPRGAGTPLPVPPDPAAWTVGGVCVALAGEPVPGDGWLARRIDDRCLVAVVDGLGHGLLAADAAAQALRVAADVAPHAGGPLPLALLQRAHAALRATRGAALAIVELEGQGGVVRFAGLGNVAASVVEPGGSSRSMVSHNGIVGHQAARVQEFTYARGMDAIVVLATDGVRPQWRLEQHPGLAQRHPTVIAATLWRDHARGRDDATVVVVRQGPWGAAPGGAA